MRLMSAIAVAALTMPTGVLTAQKELSKLELAAHGSVTLQLQNVPLSEALQALAEIGSIEIRLDWDIDGTKPVTVRFVRARFDEALELLLNSQKLGYTVPDPKTVFVTTKPGAQQSSANAPVANVQPLIRLQFEVYRNGSLVAKPRFLLADKAPGTMTIDNVATMSFTPTRMDAERIAVTFEIAAGGQRFSRQLVLVARTLEPGTLSWKSSSGEDVELRVVSP